VSVLDGFLKQDLSFRDGLAELLNGTEVRQWLEIGGAAEDQFLGSELLGAASRSRHHFHNPLASWDLAGLDAISLCPPFRLSGQASVRWAQNPSQGISGQAAWGDARNRFIDSLILSSRTRRDEAFAQSLQILGQQMHLITDLAVPAHTRNDPHCPSPEGFERWVSRNPALVESLLAGDPIRPSLTIFSVGVPIADPVAVVPIARLWDTDQYSGTNPDVTANNPIIGLAEYTNANFFSDDTVFGQFSFPAPTSVELSPPEPEPLTGELRRYFKKVRDGERVDHLAVPSALFDALPTALKDRRKGLDENVFRDYAARLLPRAVGYSAALLDYFFRNRFDVDLLPDTNDPSLVRVSGTNASSDPNAFADPLVDGTLKLYKDAADGTRSEVATLDPVGFVGVPGGGPVTSARFQLPPDAERFVAVYQGTLGNEIKDPSRNFPGGVIGKVLGGYRVEQLFPDGTRWNLRTPKGIFPLPILQADVVDLPR
jgi:hypothetical protein